TQSSTPPVHWSTPCLHSPTLLPHTPPTPGRGPSSTMPLQLLSRPSQVSGIGSFEGVQLQPAIPLQISVPLLHGGGSVPGSEQLPPVGGHQLISGLISGK